MLDAVRIELKATEAAKLTVEKQTPITLTTVAVAPRMVRILKRGNWMDESGEQVTPGVPEFLPQPPAKEGRLTRLDLANWLVARENPLTARVFVNRLWKLYFGAGLSRKLDDVGARRMADASRVARLARRRFCRFRLGHQADGEVDRHVRSISPVVSSFCNATRD